MSQKVFKNGDIVTLVTPTSLYTPQVVLEADLEGRRGGTHIIANYYHYNTYRSPQYLGSRKANDFEKVSTLVLHSTNYGSANGVLRSGLRNLIESSLKERTVDEIMYLIVDGIVDAHRLTEEAGGKRYVFVNSYGEYDLEKTRRYARTIWSGWTMQLRKNFIISKEESDRIMNWLNAYNFFISVSVSNKDINISTESYQEFRLAFANMMPCNAENVVDPLGFSPKKYFCCDRHESYEDAISYVSYIRNGNRAARRCVIGNTNLVEAKMKPLNGDDNSWASDHWPEGLTNFGTEIETESKDVNQEENDMTKLYKVTRKDKTEAYGTYLTTDSTGRFVLELKPSEGNPTPIIAAFDQKDVEEVRPWTFATTRKGNASAVHYVGPKNCVKVGDMFLNESGDFLRVSKVNTKHDTTRVLRATKIEGVPFDSSINDIGEQPAGDDAKS